MVTNSKLRLCCLINDDPQILQQSIEKCTHENLLSLKLKPKQTGGGWAGCLSLRFAAACMHRSHRVPRYYQQSSTLHTMHTAAYWMGGGGGCLGEAITGEIIMNSISHRLAKSAECTIYSTIDIYQLVPGSTTIYSYLQQVARSILIYPSRPPIDRLWCHRKLADDSGSIDT